MTPDQIGRYIRTSRFRKRTAALQKRLHQKPLPTVGEIASILGLPIEAVLAVLPDTILDCVKPQPTDRIH